MHSLKSEVTSLEEELAAARQGKSNYVTELLNDRTAQESRLEQLAAGFGQICEYSKEQLEKLNNFTDTIRQIENKIDGHYHAIEQAQAMIVGEQEKQSAEAAIQEPIKKFNQSLAELKQVWNELKATADEHNIALPQQALPGEAGLYEANPREGYRGFEHWLSISFG